MIKSFLIIAFSVFLWGNTFAQSTAVMRVSVKVVSGVSAEKNKDFVLSQNSSFNSKGEIVFTSSPHMDVDITTEQNLKLKNGSGKALSLKTHALITSNKKLGRHKVSIDGGSSKLNQINSNYNGSITTTIDYL